MRAVNPELRRAYYMIKKQFAVLGALRYNFSRIPRLTDEKKKYESEIHEQKIVGQICDTISRNKRGFDIFITPLHEKFFYLLVDDIRDYDLFKSWGPIYAQKTSSGSRQGVIKLPVESTVKDGLEWEAARMLSGELNRSIGDDKVANPQQPMRLAGFRNMKPARNQELVTILLARPENAPSAEIQQKFRRYLEIAREEAQRKKAAQAYRRPAPSPAYRRPISCCEPASPASYYQELSAPCCQEAFDAACSRHSSISDLSVRDYRAICDLVRAGFTESEMIAVLASRSGRKHDPQKYATRTVQKVAERYRQFCESKEAHHE